MSQKKMKKKGQDVPVETVDDKPSKLDYTIAAYMKQNTPTKRTKFLHHQVNYFYAAKAIDVLLDSTWATGKDPIFTDRQSVVDYCNSLLSNKFFHRAKKIAITDKDLKPKELKKKRDKEEKEKEKEKSKKEKDKKKAKDHAESKYDSEDVKKEEDVEEEVEETKKKRKKIKLDMHLDQVFVDGSDAYVWMYDPVPFWYYIIGALCLLAAVGICLFPLWPPIVRKGVYYLSVAAAGFLGFILGLAVIRFTVFLLIWVLSMGRHHLWLLPNLTEDVGFFASFWPLFHYEYRGTDYDRKKSKKKKKTTLTVEDEAKKSEQDTQENVSACDTDRQTDGERPDGRRTNSDSDNSEHSQPFEMVDRGDLDEQRDTDDQEVQDGDDDEEETSHNEEESSSHNDDDNSNNDRETLKKTQ